jgi:hypothetical protein
MRSEILNIALENLNRQAKIKAGWFAEGELDGLLKLTVNNNKYLFNVKVKKELRQYQLAQLIELNQRFNNIIIVAEQIYPKIKEQLRELDIPYLEANGNFFFRTKECFCLVDTQNKIPIRKETANRAFTKTGLKVVFHLLNNSGLVNKKQREIAGETGVGLGNIPQILNGLKETGYLLLLKKGIYVWENKAELINRWINEYATELRPKIKIGEFAIKDNWQDTALDYTQTVWGGEPAADLLTNYLRPEKFLLYTKESKLDLIRKYRLIPKDPGELEALEMFWGNNKNETTAPPLLIYAELMITGGKRNIEIANMIYDAYIKPKL